MKFELNEIHRNITNEELLIDIKRVAALLNKNVLTMTEYDRHGKYSSSTIQKRFNGWGNACSLCGLVNKLSTSDEELLVDMNAVVKKLGKTSLTRREYAEHGKYGSYDIESRFGSWNKALEQAGIDITLQRGFGNNDLFEEIERVWVQLGRQPTTTDVKAGISRYGLTTYIRHFGSWRKALEAFVAYINEDDNSEGIIPKNEAISDITSEEPKHKTKRDVSLRMRFLVLKRDSFKCCMCGASPAKDPSVELHIDHIIPWSKGGETVIDNLQTLCSKCNLGKSNLE